MIRHRLVCPKCGKTLCLGWGIQLKTITCRCGYVVRFTKENEPSMDYVVDMKAALAKKKVRRKTKK